MKTCSKCRTEKPIDEFRLVLNKQGAMVHHSWCNACKNADVRARYWRNRPEKDQRQIRRIMPIGEQAHTAKLSDDDVRLIRQLEPPKYREVAADVAEKFEVSMSTVLQIWKGATWTHV